ncbi:MAG: GIY-YIG nuclease family protein [Rickettsia endosymbiont of Stiretrus anchorago]|nr:GIY-YIG nuclease family protein [Rickettsia endosymbiont of Stiretrus anchorago]
MLANLIKKLLPLVPTLPGIYLMYNSDKEIIYIGKAKNLKKRLNYYSKNNLRGRIARMVHQVYLVEYKVTTSESEAFLMETQLIKQHQPRFNILLRRYKSASYIKLRSDHDFPTLVKCYLDNSTGNKLFGPFTSGNQIDLIITELQKIFKLRTCSDSDFALRKRPCLEYEIGKCFAPCTGNISKEDYAELIEQINDFLSSNIEKLLGKLAFKMQALSDDSHFEKAALIRDRINLIKLSKLRIGKQYEGIIDADVIVIREDSRFQIKVLLYRGGQKWGEQNYSPIYNQTNTKAEVLESFIGQFYQTRKPAKEIIINVPLQNSEVIISSLKKLYNIKTKFVIPKRGSKAQILMDLLTTK